MHQAALEVIATVGLEVPKESWRRKLEQAGASLSSSRVQFPPAMVEEFLSDWRELNHLPDPGWPEAPPPRPVRGLLPCDVNIYPHHYVDLESDEIRPLTSEALIAFTGLVNQFANEGVRPATPGIPQDVPTDLQPIAQYRIGAQYSRGGGQCGWLAPPATAEYVLRMAEVMGTPIRYITVYNPSPLRFGGVELEVVLAFPGQFQSVGVGSMPCAGSTAPLFPKAAMVLALAEGLSAAIALRIITGLPVHWGAHIDPFDFRATNMVYGTPEMLLFHEMAKQVGAYYRGAFPTGGGHYIQTMAKQPGIQAAVDKAASAGFAVCCGADSLNSVGSLCFDEVFSPEQLVVDLEIRDWAARLGQGIEVEGDEPRQWVDLIRDGVVADSFLNSDETLEHYREVYWMPRLLDRTMLSRWLHAPEEEVREKAKRIARERMADDSYRLAEPQWSQVEEIQEEAQRRLLG